MRRAALALPVLFLALSLDVACPERSVPPAEAVVSGWNEAAPAFPEFSEARGEPAEAFTFAIAAHEPALRAALSESGWSELPGTWRGALAAGMLPAPVRRLRGRRPDALWRRRGGPRRPLRIWRSGLLARDGRPFWWGTGDRDALAASLAGSPRVRALLADGRAAVIDLSSR